MKNNKGSATYYLIAQQSIVHDVRTVVDCVTARVEQDGVTVTLDSRHADGSMLQLGLRDGERALIKSLKLLYCTNDTGHEVRGDIDLCFDPPRPAGSDDVGKKPSSPSPPPPHPLPDHPDRSGHVITYLSTTGHGVVTKRHRRLYKPNFSNIDFDMLSFLGMEHSISNARSGVIVPSNLVGDRSAVASCQIFLKTDPFFVFLLATKTLVGWPDEHVRAVQGLPDHYSVENSTVERVRALCVRSVFPMFRYCTRPSLRFKWTVEADAGDGDDLMHTNATIVAMFEIKYYVVYQRVPKFNDVTLTRIKL